MKENKYNDPSFFDQYSQMNRSLYGLQGAGEWHALQKMLPDFRNKRVLDLGCGFGWHCGYAVAQGARSVVGIDLSERMLQEARKRNNSPLIDYQCMAIEDFSFIPNTFDIVISSLAFHYLESFDTICNNVNKCLSDDGVFVFSVEHPIFTASGAQDWHYDKHNNRQHWPVDRYFCEGERKTTFLGEDVVKYHKTLTTYVNSLIKHEFEITELIEPEPQEELLVSIPDLKDELRRPMMLLISAKKR